MKCREELRVAKDSGVTAMCLSNANLLASDGPHMCETCHPLDIRYDDGMPIECLQVVATARILDKPRVLGLVTSTLLHGISNAMPTRPSICHGRMKRILVRELRHVILTDRHRRRANADF